MSKGFVKTQQTKKVLFGGGWVRLCETTNTKGELIPLSDLEDKEKLASRLASAPEKDWYTSVYHYGQDAKTHWDKNKSMAGYKGSALSSKLIFDLDSTNVVEARDDALTLLDRLQAQGVEVETACRIYFSGSKGFHIEVFIDQELQPDKLKLVCKNIASGLDTFDPVVYNATRLYRLKDTKHQTSNLYKIEIQAADLVDLTVDQIKDQAKTRSIYNAKITPFAAKDLIEKYSKVPEPNFKANPKTNAQSGIRGLGDIDFTKCPKDKPRCIFALEHGVMESGKGERNHLFLRLAAWYRNQGLTKDVAYNTLKGVARENHRLYPETKAFDKDEIWRTVINSVYAEHNAWKVVPGAVGTGADNEMLHRYCEAAGDYTNSKCPLHGKVLHEKAVRIDEVANTFGSFAENYDRNIVKTGIDFIDTNMNISIGTSNLLVGCAGSGKTTLVLNMMENSNANGQHTMFFSMDMHKNMVFLKLAQKLSGLNKEQILEAYKKHDTKTTDMIKAKIAAKYGKTYFDFAPTLTFEQIRDRIFNTEQKTGKKIKLVVIDYASRIAATHGDRYAAATHNALLSKAIADETNTAMVILSQISRNVGDGCTPLRTKRAAKESGDWEEAASNVITCWRPFMGDPDNDNVMRLFLAKNRMGPELEQPLYWNGAKGIVRDMDPYDLQLYQDPQNGREKDEKEYLKQKNGRS